MPKFVSHDLIGRNGGVYSPASLVEGGLAWGMEALVDMFDCDPARINDVDFIAQFGLDLCEKIGMKPYGEPQVPVFGLADPKTVGPSLVLLIETSLVSAHFARHWDQFVALNVHSCQAFDANEAALFAADRFGAGAVSVRVLTRGLRLAPRDDRPAE